MTIITVHKPKLKHTAKCNKCDKSLSVSTDRWDLARLVKKTTGWQWVNREIQYCPDHAGKVAAKPAKKTEVKKAVKTSKKVAPVKKALTGAQKVLAKKVKEQSDKPKRKSYYKPVSQRVPVAPVIKEVPEEVAQIIGDMPYV